MQKFEHLLNQLREIGQQALTNWAENLQSQIENSLKVSILIQNPKSRELHLNFNPHLSAILREVHYLKLMKISNIPEDALKLAEKNETFRTYIVNLNSTITWYNKIRRTTKPVEFDLIKNEVCQIDKMVNLGQSNLNWNSEGMNFDLGFKVFYPNFSTFLIIDLWDYITNLHSLVKHLQDKLTKCQENLNSIKAELIPFARKPLFERKDGKKDFLCLEDRHERLSRRHNEIREAYKSIMNLLNSNMELFGMTNQSNRSEWINYVDFVDKIVLNYLYQSLGCRFVVYNLIDLLM